MGHELFLIGQFDEADNRFRIPPDKLVVLGRSSSCDLIATNVSVSRRHAELSAAANGVRIKDLGSRNGTFIDNKRIECSVARPGQKVSFGSAAYLVREPCCDKAPCDEESTDEVTPHHVAFESLRSKLTAAQLRVFDLLILGLPDKEMAGRLHLSPNTIKHHVMAIYEAMEVNSRAQFMYKIRMLAAGDTVSWEKAPEWPQ